MEIYETSLHPLSVVGIFEKDQDNEDFSKIYDEILFQIFLHEYKMQYVGEDTAELPYKIITATTTVLAGIKAQFVNSHTNETVTLSPEDVIKKW